MNKVAAYLQEHLHGEVLATKELRDYFSTDASVLTITPSMVAYPRSTNDVRKILRFSWQLAEQGRILPVTGRGMGTDQSGAAIGQGIIVVFPAHMNKLLEVDTKQNRARIQPGINYRTFQQAMHTHGRTLPPYPASYDYSTIGGAIANNSAGEKSVKYGDTRKFVDQLEVVLANGELIQTGRISRKELDRKKGETTLEAEIYRQVDGIITDNETFIHESSKSRVSKNSSGYDLVDVKHQDGSFDLTPLIVGSQGTLGLVTEAIMKLIPYNPQSTLLVAEFADVSSLHDAVSSLMLLGPSALEMVDKHLLEFVEKQYPRRLKNLVSEELPSAVLLVEFDDLKSRLQKTHAKKAFKILSRLAHNVRQTTDSDEQDRLWGIRHAAATVVNYSDNGSAALPIIEDGIVPHEEFENYIEAVYALFKKYRLQIALWGHAGDANLHMQPFLDLSKLGDRQKVPKIMQEYYDLVIKLGGSIAAEHNDGRLRAPFMEQQWGNEMIELYGQVQKAFDPYGMLNPGVKKAGKLSELAGILRKEFSIAHFSEHLPRS